MDILIDIYKVAKFGKAQLSNVSKMTVGRFKFIWETASKMIIRQLFVLIKQSSEGSRLCWRDPYNQQEHDP